MIYGDRLDKISDLLVKKLTSLVAPYVLGWGAARFENGLNGIYQRMVLLVFDGSHPCELRQDIYTCKQVLEVIILFGVLPYIYEIHTPCVVYSGYEDMPPRKLTDNTLVQLFGL